MITENQQKILFVHLIICLWVIVISFVFCLFTEKQVVVRDLAKTFVEHYTFLDNRVKKIEGQINNFPDREVVMVMFDSMMDMRCDKCF